MANLKGSIQPQEDSESGSGSNNNLYQGPFEKSFSGDNIANGMGLARPAALKGMEGFAGSEASEWAKLKEREIARFNDLKAKAFGRSIPITNEGIVLDSFGGMVGEGMSYPKLNEGQQDQGEVGRRV